jgi:quercetin dioxygenase-like cupin family protein
MEGKRMFDNILDADNAIRETFDWGELTWYANAQLGNAQSLTLGRCRIKSGQENPKHHHTNCEEILHLEQGEIVHTLGDQSIKMTVGDTIVIPPHLVHNARNTGDEEAIMFIAFSSASRETKGK